MLSWRSFLAVLAAALAGHAVSPRCQVGVTLAGLGEKLDGNYMSWVDGSYSNDRVSVSLLRIDNKSIAEAGGTDFDPADTQEYIEKWLLVQAAFSNPYTCGFYRMDPTTPFQPCRVYAVCAQGCPDLPGYNVPFEGHAMWDAAIWPSTGSFAPQFC